MRRRFITRPQSAVRVAARAGGSDTVYSDTDNTAPNEPWLMRWGGRRTIIDGACLLVAALVGLASLIWPWINHSATTAPDDVFGTPIFWASSALIVAAVLFAWRRTQDVRAERDRRQQAERRLNHLVHCDPVTQLPNRALFTQRLTQELARIERQGGIVAVHCLTLDRFKAAADALGPSGADGVLRAVAERLRLVLRTTDTLACFGGHEFAVLQVALKQPSGAARLARRLIKATEQPFFVQGEPVGLAAMIGIALAPHGGTDAETLIRAAGIARFRAASETYGRVRFFAAEMDRHVRHRQAIEREFRGALGAGQLHLHYQPIVGAETGTILGFEALARWQHPERGAVAPDAFIPVAEDAGLINEVGAWVLETACRQAQAWPAGVRLSVNVSPLQLQERDLTERVAAILARTGMPGDRVDLEITEQLLLDDSERIWRTLKRLKALGIQISVDDFGAGYAGLRYLRRFPFDKIKIDQSFVRDLHQHGAAAIVRSVLTLGASLSIPVTAEGVETETQRTFLANEGCHAMQGFLLGRPMPAAQTMPYLGAIAHPCRPAQPDKRTALASESVTGTPRKEAIKGARPETAPADRAGRPAPESTVTGPTSPKRRPA